MGFPDSLCCCLFYKKIIPFVVDPTFCDSPLLLRLTPSVSSRRHTLAADATPSQVCKIKLGHSKQAKKEISWV
ncbi:unnamed protein product [Cuscuta campestris]|uniref:Uncharacterized protein n=1 Tax=Cuscuta campestris TaxID=132261 RepID=A0A484LFN1_9ASTE|nr:unnamed protein product [Cuscuta campestris]